MDAILDEIDAVLAAGLSYVAVALSLTLPGICAALESPTGSTRGEDGVRYKRWYDAHLASIYPNITSADCYSLRCGVVHQGRFGVECSQYERVLFMVPNPQRNVVHNCIDVRAGRKVLILDAHRFCRDIMAAVRRWFETVREEATVGRNLSQLVEFRPDGLAPYVTGMPMIA